MHDNNSAKGYDTENPYSAFIYINDNDQLKLILKLILILHLKLMSNDINFCINCV